MQMERPPVHRRRDAGAGEIADELVAIGRQAIEPQPNREKVPGVNPIGAFGRQLDLFDVRQRGEIAVGDRLPRLAHAFGPRQLVQPK